MRYSLAILAFLLLGGCAGKIYTIENPTADSKGRIDGVIIYQPKPIVLFIETTEAKDKDGNLIGSSQDGTCRPVRSFEVTSIPDYTKRYAIGYDAALFESKKFSLELDRGVVTKVNNESTSAAKDALDVFKGILSTVKEITTIKSAIDAKEMPACNCGKKIIGRMDFADIPEIKLKE